MKKSFSKHTVVAAVAIAACAWLRPATSQAQDTPQEQWNKRYRSDYEIPLGNYTGRSPYMQGAPMVKAPKRAPKPAPAPAPAPAPKTSCNDPTWGLIRMNKTMPPEAALGANFTAELRITAQACAGNVVIRDTVPAGASYVSSDPSATVDGNQLVWKLGDLNSGESRTIKITLKADREGTLVNCAVVSADPRVCAATVVGKPVLAIDKTGPATAALGADVRYNIVVRNTGSAIARNVVVTDAVPEGMGGQPANVAVGDLAPGQSKNLTVTFKANQRGKVCNTATANSSNAAKVSAGACTTIQQPGLKIQKSTNDKELLIGKAASYNIVVKNTGDTALTGVVVTDTAAAGTTIVSAQGGSVTGTTATWNVGELAAGASKSFKVSVLSRNPGNFCDAASVTSAQGLKDSAQACTLWKGVTGVLLEMLDDPDPIQVGETSKYTIRVTNQGSTMDISDLNIVTTLPAELDIVPGTVSDGGVLSGKTITWPAVPKVAPKASVTRTYTAKGVKAGDARSKVAITTSMRKEPIDKFESTTVY